MGTLCCHLYSSVAIMYAMSKFKSSKFIPAPLPGVSLKCVGQYGTETFVLHGFHKAKLVLIISVK